MKTTALNKNLNKKTIKLRAHHGMCLAFFEGKGYNDGFTASMQAILTQLKQENPCLEVVAETDSICAACPHLANGFCENADLVQSYDRQVLSLCGMEEHTLSDWESFSARVAERILSQGKRKDICGGCQWSAICTAKEHLYRS